MDRNTPLGGKGGTGNYAGVNAKLEGAAQSAHVTTDRIADTAAAKIDNLSDSAHRVVDSASKVATNAAGWASGVAGQASDIQRKAVDSASATIRQQPLTMVAGALVIGYLLGRL